MAGYNLLTPGHRSIRKYYENAAALRDQGVLNEMSVRSPFESLLQETARLNKTVPGACEETRHVSS